MTETLNIKAGDWICLANGATDGPMIEGNNGDFFANMEYYNGGSNWFYHWRTDGTINEGGEWERENLNVIATLPAAPLDHIRALEARVEKLERALRPFANLKSVFGRDGFDPQQSDSEGINISWALDGGRCDLTLGQFRRARRALEDSQ